MSDFLNIESEYSSKFDVANIYPIVAWNMLLEDKKSILVDVRTELEWDIVGYPDLSSLSKEVYKISWKIAPKMDYNKNFIDELKQLAKDYNTPLLFICKTGGRSSEAALKAISAGYTNCYNIINGFEGVGNPSEDYNKGWKEQQLPWKRS